jgi:hypothetical protein
MCVVVMCNREWYCGTAASACCECCSVLCVTLLSLRLTIIMVVWSACKIDGGRVKDFTGVPWSGALVCLPYHMSQALWAWPAAALQPLAAAQMRAQVCVQHDDWLMAHEKAAWQLHACMHWQAWLGHCEFCHGLPADLGEPQSAKRCGPHAHTHMLPTLNPD